jgi:hypothetical protein
MCTLKCEGVGLFGVWGLCKAGYCMKLFLVINCRNAIGRSLRRTLVLQMPWASAVFKV